MERAQAEAEARVRTRPVERPSPRPPRTRRLRPVLSARRPTPDLIGVPEIGTVDFRLWGEWLGHRLADSGPSTIEAHLARFATIAIDLGVAGEHARLVTDTSQPDIVRARSFFRVAMALDEAPGY